MEGIHKTCVVSCLLIVNALAAGTGTLRGIVHDPQHRPLPGAQVVLHDPKFDMYRRPCNPMRMANFKSTTFRRALIPSPFRRRASGRLSSK